MKMTLTGLTNTRKVRKCEFVSSATAVLRCLRKKVAATTAGDYGAINVWGDKDGDYRCDAMRYCATVDFQIFTNLNDVFTWSKKWIKEIELKP
jgi:hypothetical protein